MKLFFDNRKRINEFFNDESRFNYHTYGVNNPYRIPEAELDIIDRTMYDLLKDLGLKRNSPEDWWIDYSFADSRLQKGEVEIRLKNANENYSDEILSAFQKAIKINFQDYRFTNRWNIPSAVIVLKDRL